MSFFGASSPKGTRRTPVAVSSRSYVRRVYEWVSAEERAPLVSAALKLTGFIAACAWIRYRGTSFAPDPMEEGMKDPYGGTFTSLDAWHKQRQVWLQEQALKAQQTLPQTI